MIEQPFLDGFLKAEAEARESSTDSETYLRRKLALAHRWFEYYKREKNPEKKSKLVSQYNRIGLMIERENQR